MRALLILAVLAVLPRPAGAATCASFAPPPSQPIFTLVLEVAPVGGFATLVGELVPPPGDPCPSVPVIGSAHLRGDGKAHFGLMAVSVAPPATDCFAIWLTGVVDPPGFTSGTATGRVHSGDVADLAITPATCPPIPNRAAAR